ncbi:LuxR C-terminal-related transcriptional regulator [Streptomyces sp. NPDC008061]|uniref:helix-turn-helix transcriptional regulator n=1 Tax=Streptomyces sp. NPDC008061 TaxID=3364805 RepID=UPI0036E6D31B
MSGSKSSRPMQVIVLAEDRLTAQGVEAHLAADDSFRVLTSDSDENPDVLLIVTTGLTEKTFASLQHFSQKDSNKNPALVLVGNRPTTEQLVRAIGMGLVAFMSRERTTLAEVSEMLHTVSRGAASLPQPLLGSLLDQLRSRWNDQAVVGNSDSSPFTEREIAVLRQLAAGFSTAEIAVALHYSERTVKYIIHEMIVKHGLRNRVHAVAYALRQDLL